MTFTRTALTALAAGALTLPLLAAPASAAPGDTPIPPARQIDGFCINPGTSQFTDVQASGDANANELALAVRCLATAEVAQGGPMGRPATQYGPELNVTRGQMSSFIARVIDASVAREVREPRVEELPEPAAGDPFTDVPDGDIHENNIKRLSQAGVVNGSPGGIGEDRFGPELPVTRGQMASFINRAVAYMEGGDPGDAGSSEENGFAAEDAEYYVDELQQVHEDNINGITSAGISQGVGGDRYASQDNVTRRQMARFLSRTLAAINVPDGDQLVLTLRELFSANFPDGDREPETRVASSPDDEPTPATSRTYTAEGLDTEEEFRISLVESGQIERDSDDNNEVRFETDMIEGGFAVNTGMPTSRIVEVNGEEPQTQGAAGTEPTDSGPTASAVTEPEDDGSITFTIQGEMPEDVTPVLYYNGGGDQTDFQDGGGNSPRLETDADGRPIEFFSVAGETTFADEGAATGSGSGSGGGGLPLPLPLPLPGLLNSVSNGLLSLLD